MSYFNTMRTLDETVELLETNIDACFEGLVAVWKRQTDDERQEKSTKHKNLFGFSKKHVTPGTRYALAYINGTDAQLSQVELDEVRWIALRYRKQVWMISCGAIPENNLRV